MAQTSTRIIIHKTITMGEAGGNQDRQKIHFAHLILIRTHTGVEEGISCTITICDGLIVEFKDGRYA